MSYRRILLNLLLLSIITISCRLFTGEDTPASDQGAQQTLDAQTSLIAEMEAKQSTLDAQQVESQQLTADAQISLDAQVTSAINETAAAYNQKSKEAENNIATRTQARAILLTNTAEAETETTAPTNTPISPDFTPTTIMNLPYQDTFDLRLDPKWQPMIGTWRVVDGELTTDPGAGWRQIFIGDPQWRNYTVEVDARMDDWYYPAQIIVRAQEDGYMAFQFSIHGTDLLLYSNGKKRVIAHSDTGLRDVPGGGRYNNSFHIHVDVNEDIFAIYINGIQTLQAQDGTRSKGRIGLAFDTTNNAWFDNFEINELP